MHDRWVIAELTITGYNGRAERSGPEVAPAKGVVPAESEDR